MGCGLFAIIYLAATEKKVLEWIFPTRITASLMIAAGFWFIVRRTRA